MRKCKMLGPAEVSRGKDLVAGKRRRKGQGGFGS